MKRLLLVIKNKLTRYVNYGDTIMLSLGLSHQLRVTLVKTIIQILGIWLLICKNYISDQSNSETLNLKDNPRNGEWESNGTHLFTEWPKCTIYFMPHLLTKLTFCMEWIMTYNHVRLVTSAECRSKLRQGLLSEEPVLIIIHKRPRVIFLHSSNWIEKAMLDRVYRNNYKQNMLTDVMWSLSQVHLYVKWSIELDGIFSIQDIIQWRGSHQSSEYRILVLQQTPIG